MGVWWGGRQKTPPPAPPSELRPPAEPSRSAGDAVRRQLDVLRDRVDGIEETQDELLATVADGGSPDGSGEDHSLQAPPSIQDIALAEEATAARFLARFEEEDVDASWAQGAEADFEDSALRPELGLRSISAECRETLCLVQVALSEGSAADFIQRVAFEPPWDAEFWWRAEGEDEVILYLAREGRALTPPLGR